MFLAGPKIKNLHASKLASDFQPFDPGIITSPYQTTKAGYSPANRPLAVLTLHSFEFAAVLSPWPYLQKTGAEFIYSIPRPFFTSTGKQPTPYIPRYLSLSIAAIKFSSCSGVRFSIGLRILVVAMIPSRFSITLYAAILLFSQSVSFRRFVLCCHLAASS